MPDFKMLPMGTKQPVAANAVAEGSRYAHVDPVSMEHLMRSRSRRASHTRPVCPMIEDDHARNYQV